MYGSWNFVVTLIVISLCRQVLGFWPFDVLASSDSPDEVYDTSKAKRIAIIGAGAAGSSTSYYLQKFANESGLEIDVTVFERSSYVGGRSTTVNAYDDPLIPVELGASIFVEVNTILKNSSEAFGLDASNAETETAEILGVWNGHKLVFTQKEGGWAWWDITKLIWKYGWAPVRTNNLMKKTVGKFRKLYEYPFFPFRSLSDRAFDLGLTEVTAMTGQELLAANNIGPPFSTDIIQASTRVNYGQNLNSIHGLETMVCMAIEGAMSIKGGNWQIFDAMLKASNATVLLNTAVDVIAKDKGKYVMKTLPNNTTSISDIAPQDEEVFDTIVLAAPLQYSGITFEKDFLRHTPDEIPYVNLHVTLFTSTLPLNGAYFNLDPGAEVPTTILTTLPPDEVPADPRHGAGSTGFFSISTLRTLVNPKTLQKERLYKIFSPEKITPEFLTNILGAPMPDDLNTIAIDSGDAISWYYPHEWNSYPYELPRVTFEELELSRGLYYTSGMESFISTMETSALMGMNVAQLIVDDYNQVLEVDNSMQKVISEQQGQEVEEL
ncbi:Chloride ion pump-associated 55 kDa [Hyphodiscus hymeniophilus]|uniref:Chloride ion pump-associated 55 kDa n=1 Tax=Hyphodiscus hymeniophilus TaxID=353542 RepID=A0A9P6VFN6_9HELO|nr:Chloride ion pump-associated 55 kDa [Hyphodiscus hymeniophilus]